MKNLFQISIVLLLLICAFACTNKEDEFDKSPAPAQVIDPTWVATNGGALISYTLPIDKNLLFVKAVYVNSLGKTVFRSSSQYNTQVEIDGFNDLESHEVKLISVGHNGKESEPKIIEVVPDKSYIELIKENMVIEKAIGGIKIQWYNPSQKPVYVYVYYDNEQDTISKVERILASERENYDMTIRGLDSNPYQVDVIVEDLTGNKTALTDKGMHTPDPEQKIDKTGWTPMANLSCVATKWEGKIDYFVDDVIDVIELGGRLDTDPNGNNSYFIIHKEDNSDPIQWINGSTELTHPLLLVYDMHKYAVLSRIKYWQRAFHYDSNEPNSTANSTYHYYTETNMRSFFFMGLTEEEMVGMTKAKLAAKIWTDHWIHCDVGDPHDADGNIPKSKYDEAIEGHEFVLSNLSQPFRYLVIGITASFGSETQIEGSEITLWGEDGIEYKPGEPEE